jgi:hypothetical protein
MSVRRAEYDERVGYAALAGMKEGVYGIHVWSIRFTMKGGVLSVAEE